MAQAILLQPVDTLGERGDVVDVSPRLPAQLPGAAQAGPAGHGRSTGGRERRAEAAERAATEQVERAQETAGLLRKTVLTIAHQAGDDGRLFGSVTAQEIADAVRQARGVKLDKRRIQLTEPIKTTGTHMVTVEVADGVTADVKTIVTSE